MPANEHTDPAVAALKRLIGDTAKRRIEVADAIDFNEQTLYQIAAGIPLKSGKPRGVGRDLRQALDAHFPNWLTAIEGEAKQRATLTAPQDLPALLRQLGLHLANMEPERRAELADLMAAWVKGAGKPSYETLVAECIATPAAPPEKRQARG